jgi:hypothetical protein
LREGGKHFGNMKKTADLKQNKTEEKEIEDLTL